MEPKRSTDCCANGYPLSVLLFTENCCLEKSILQVVNSHYQLDTVSVRSQALDLIQENEYECVILEMQNPVDETIGFLKRIRKISGKTAVMLLCSAAEISSAVEGIRAGASDFVIKEVEIGNLTDRIAKVTGKIAKTQKVAPGFPCQRQSGAPAQMVVGRSPRMLEVMEIARRAATYPVSILLLGENGTGKGLFAHWIHRMSQRKEGPYIGVNLAAIPSELVESTLFGHEKGAFTGAVGQRTGKFVQAQNGTLLLDEITELKFELQPKLLRVLQEGEFERVGSDRILYNEARIIAATNKNIYELVQNGEFRSDLFYRLNIVTITLPPLRERREDIPDLVRLFLGKYNRLYGRNVRGITNEGMDALLNHSWPGNIRELEHSIQRSIIVCDSEFAEIKHLFDTGSSWEFDASFVGRAAEEEKTLEELEQEYIEEVLNRTQGHQGQAAKILGIDRKTLYNKIMKFGLRRSLEQTG